MKLPKDHRGLSSRLIVLIPLSGGRDRRSNGTGNANVLPSFTAKMVVSSDPIEETAEDRESETPSPLKKSLLAKFQLLGDCLITVCVCRVEVIKQTTALPYHDQQAAPRTVIFLISLQMFG